MTSWDNFSKWLAYATNPKLAEKADEMALQTYITQKLAPFDNYQFEDADKEEVRKAILARFPSPAELKRRRVGNQLSDHALNAAYIRERFKA